MTPTTPGPRAYAYARVVGGDGPLHIRPASDSVALCRVRCGASLPDAINRARLPETCVQCAVQYVALLQHGRRAARVRVTRDSERSRARDELLRQLRLSGVPAPELDWPFAEHLGRKWAFDLAWLRVLLAVEVDGSLGYGGHTTHAGREDDMVRDACALALGWRVLRVSPRLVWRGYAATWTLTELARRIECSPASERYSTGARRPRPEDFPTPRQLRPKKARTP